MKNGQNAKSPVLSSPYHLISQ